MEQRLQDRRENPAIMSIEIKGKVEKYGRIINEISCT